jgi:hypothetical protein
MIWFSRVNLMLHWGETGRFNKVGLGQLFSSRSVVVMVLRHSLSQKEGKPELSQIPSPCLATQGGYL